MNRSLSVILLLFCTGCAAPAHFSTMAPGGVAMYLDMPKVSSVVFVSSQDNYLHHALMRDNDGLWVKTGLADEEFRYFYLVDGNVHVPDCGYREADDFGRMNCIHLPGMNLSHRQGTAVSKKE